MSEAISKKEISAFDVFNELRAVASTVDLTSAQANQKDPKRRAFINALIENLQLYDLEPERQKTIGVRDPKYYVELKTILSSRTDLVIRLIETCQKNDFDGFATLSRYADWETLRRLGKLPKPAPKLDEKIPTPASLRGERVRGIFEQLASDGSYAIDVRRHAVRTRYKDLAA